MRFPTFARFAAPSVVLMVALLALPLLVTFYLSVRNCTLQMELVVEEQSGPFGVSRVETMRAKVDASGTPIRACRYVGAHYFKRVLGLSSNTLDAPSVAEPPDAAGGSAAASAAPGAPSFTDSEFIRALRFTLLYTLVTTPFVLVIGFALALGVQQVHPKLKGAFISLSLLPFIITPVVAALSIKWMFRDGGLVPHLLSNVGVQVFWMAEAWSARFLIVLYGVWHVVPFAFIVLYAGLQSVPQDSLEAARIDGANAWQRMWYVTLPHLAPLMVFITLIHLMDAYRVFEPVMVLTQGAFTQSVQYLTYQILIQENNPFKASAAAVLTTAGIAVLLVPLLVRTWKEHRRG